MKWVSQVKILAFYNATSPSEQQQKSPKKSKLSNLWLKFQSLLLGPPVECVDQSGWGLDQRVPAVLVVSLISNLTSFSRIGVQSNMTSLRSSYIDRVRLKYPSRKLQVTHTLRLQVIKFIWLFSYYSQGTRVRSPNRSLNLPTTSIEYTEPLLPWLV